MRVLLVHNYYGSEAPSGENLVFEAEKDLLEQRGHEVALFSRYSDEIRGQGLWGAIKGAASVPWNPFSAAAMRRVIQHFQPDVVHVHNTYPLISPAIFHAIGKRAARVLTLHNYRLLCPAAIPMRTGRVCTDCIDRHSVKPALWYGCYRSSRVATTPLAVNVALHRALGTWRHQVDAFIALSNFQKQRMSAGGLPDEKIHVKPNFYGDTPVVTPYAKRPGYVVFVGRLGEEKGVRTLIDAWRRWGSAAPELRMVGDGPLREELQQQATGLAVKFYGQVNTDTAQKHIANARLLLLPSEWYETFGMVVIQAFAAGTPAAVSNLGALPSIVCNGINGVVFEPANAESLLQIVRKTLANSSLLDKLAVGARESFESLYNENANYKILMDIYEQAIVVNGQR